MLPIENEPHFVVQEEETQKETSEDSDDGFNEADEEDIPAENYLEESKNELRESRQPLVINGSNKRELSGSQDSFSTIKTRMQPSVSQYNQQYEH